MKAGNPPITSPFITLVLTSTCDIVPSTVDEIVERGFGAALDPGHRDLVADFGRYRDGRVGLERRELGLLLQLSRVRGSDPGAPLVQSDRRAAVGIR